MTATAAGRSLARSRTRSWHPEPQHAHIDRSFAALGVVVGLLPWGSTFGSWRYLAVGALGAVLGIGCAVVVRWSGRVWLGSAGAVLVVFGALIFVVAGGPAPTRADLTSATLLPVTGWKQLLSTAPPVDAARELAGLPFLLAVLAAVAGVIIAGTTRSSWACSLPAIAVTVVTIATGTPDAWRPELVGLGGAILAVVWAALRRRRRLRIVGTGGGARQQLAIAAGLLSASALLAWVAAPHLPGIDAERRFGFRSLVAPPFDITEYPSPLSGYRKFTEPMDQLWSQELLTTTGLPTGSRLRLAVLDHYAGSVWSAGSATASGGTFERVGSTIRTDGVTSTAPQQVRITVGPAYAALPELKSWVPGVGAWSSVHFSGPREEQLRSSLRYNRTTAQGLIPQGLAPGDVVTLSARPIALAPQGGFSPFRTSLIDAGSTAFVSGLATQWAGPAESVWTRVVTTGQQLRDSGVLNGGPQIMPGHSQGRLTAFLANPIGTDEQYAAAFALLANELGMPTRVVLGAVIPAEGSIRGKDVRAWVEMRSATGEWFALANDAFMPAAGDRANQLEPEKAQPIDHPNVPPPVPDRPPGDTDSLSDAEAGLLRPKSGASGASPEDRIDWPPWLVSTVAVAGRPAGVLGAVALLFAGGRSSRRWRRRTTGSPSRRLASGWRDLLDHSRDLGTRVDALATRREQAQVIGHPDLAAAADAAVFGVGDPTEQDIRRFWDQARAARRARSRLAPWWRRLLRPWNPRSLLARDRAPRVPTGRRPGGRERSVARAAGVAP